MAVPQMATGGQAVMSDRYPKTWFAIMRTLSRMDGVFFVGIRVDPDEIALQVDGVSFTIHGSTEGLRDVEAAVRRRFQDALGESSPVW